MDAPRIQKLEGIREEIARIRERAEANMVEFSPEGLFDPTQSPFSLLCRAFERFVVMAIRQEL